MDVEDMNTNMAGSEDTSEEELDREMKKLMKQMKVLRKKRKKQKIEKLKAQLALEMKGESYTTAKYNWEKNNWELEFLSKKIAGILGLDNELGL